MDAGGSHKILRFSELAAGRVVRFALEPSGEEMIAMAKELGLLGLKKLRFAGSLSPSGKRDWILEAKLGTMVIQPCVVTLEPVTTRLEENVIRHYLADYAVPSEAESEMEEDDTIEPLPDLLDLNEVMHEAIALALPPFPRTKGADLGEAIFTEPGIEPLKDADLKPFAELAELKKRLEK